MITWIKNFFQIQERKSTITKEILGGLTIFLAMVYILPVNAGMLSATGMSFAAVFAATALASAIASIIMGAYAKYPVGLASGMGINAFFTYTIVFTLGFSWQEALAAVFISGILFLIVTISGLRQKVINSIPKDLKLGIGAGIGFFIAFIGLKNAGIVVGNPATLVGLGDLTHPTVLLGLFGIMLVFVLFAINKKISNFAIIISIFATGIFGWLLGIVFPSLAIVMPTFSSVNLGSVGDISETFGQAFIAIPSLLSNPMAYAVIFTLLFVDFFDTAGTLVAVGNDAGLLNKDGELVDGNKALMADSIGTIAGSILGTSTVTSYIESTTGIQQGARTGLSAVVVGILFVLALLFYPLFAIVGSIDIGGGVFLSPATALALVFVGTMMISSLKSINWEDKIVVISIFMTIIIMMLSFSIADGIAFGFITYTVMKLFTKERSEVSLFMYGVSLLFIINFIVQFVILK